MGTSRLPSDLPRPRLLGDGLAVAAACCFVFLAAFKIELPGLYMDEVDFVNAAQGGTDNTMIKMRLGPVPILLMPYLGALKAWIWAPIFRVFGVSPLTIRLPAILIAALTLLIFYVAMRGALGRLWAATVVWIMAVDSVNLFPSRLDWGPTVLMHFLQAAILALWFSYREKPQPWKPAFIFICFALGFFDKFNFIWLISSFVVGILICYPDGISGLWRSSPRFVRWFTVILVLIASCTMLYLTLPLLLYSGTTVHTVGLQAMRAMWASLLSTLSGQAVAYFIFGDSKEITPVASYWLIITDLYLALACLFSPASSPQARENRKHGFFCLLIAFFIFAQIAITPQAGGPHHYSMIFPLPLLAFGFLTKSLYVQLATKSLQRLAVLVLGFAAICLCFINVRNTAVYLSRFRWDSHYNPRWSPEIYSLSRYINQHGFEAQAIISVDWGLHNQLHALASKKLRKRMRNPWRTFKTLTQKNEGQQTAILHSFFPEGKVFTLTFAASKETFPETRRNFLAVLASHPELQSRLAKEFWSGDEKIYELYEVTRNSDVR